jgi:hypothetical protein
VEIDKEPLSEAFHNAHIARLLQKKIIEYKTKVSSKSLGIQPYNLTLFLLQFMTRENAARFFATNSCR